MLELSIKQLAFIFCAALTLLPACYAAMTRNLVRAAFSLLFCFCGIAGLYVLAGADFVAVTQILVYIGGILLLILFGLMFTADAERFEDRSSLSGKFWAIIPAGGIAAFLVYIVQNGKWYTAENLNQLGKMIEWREAWRPSTGWIGHLLLKEYVLAFEVASIALVAALIGAVFLARKEIR
jgi:NADH-quinone oxidoreductase subunit J